MAFLLAETLTFLATIFWQMLKAIVMLFIPSSEKDISNEIVLITGAGSGIGRLMAYRFAARGSIVVCVDINELENEETANEIRSRNEKAFAYTCDCSRKENIYRIAEEIQANVGDVTILINNAGIVSGKKLLDTSDGLIQKTFEVNTLAHFWVSIRISMSSEIGDRQRFDHWARFLSTFIYFTSEILMTRLEDHQASQNYRVNVYIYYKFTGKIFFLRKF